MHIEILSLSSNNFIGPLPGLIATSNNLLALDVSRNHFNGTLYELTCGGDASDNDSSVSNSASSLRFLFVNNNNLTGAIPSCIGTVTDSLQRFNVSNNHLSGEIPSALGSLRSLSKLS